MRAVVLAAALPTALAFWNGNLCGGNGGCISWGAGPSNHPWVCPDDSRLTMPLYLGNWRDAGAADVPAATQDEFPKTCWDGKYPAPGEKLMKTTTSGGQTLYTWISSNCKDGKPAAPGDCYHHNPNPSVVNFCAMYDSKGGQCKTNPNAGECERWGATTVRPQCNYWKPGLQDLPDSYYQGKPDNF
ncbi:hypothetical protein COCVIDRAFT_110597 [Bipolaris victoriae FI3]|uniref:Secreted protein n=1 Tax=Bipolaris victoriae (strain FI3) TaxID=930091 RepID=W7E3F3_BIPV3|nr:hypothetical protein COCVIDRAFT_110597 [Bipolaris victoriae FI3]